MKFVLIWLLCGLVGTGVGVRFLGGRNIKLLDVTALTMLGPITLVVASVGALIETGFNMNPCVLNCEDK